MRTLFLATAALAALVIGAPIGAHAEYVHGWVNGQYFHGTVNTARAASALASPKDLAAVQDAGGGGGGAGLGSYLPGVITAQDGRQLSFEIQVSCMAAVSERLTPKARAVRRNICGDRRRFLHQSRPPSD